MGDRKIVGENMKEGEEEKERMSNQINEGDTSTVYVNIVRTNPQILGMNMSHIIQVTDLNTSFTDHMQWQQYLANGLVSMPLGTDNVYVPLNEGDLGSIISFVLASNIYKEAMIK